eukprot:gene33382-42797_t
MARVVDACLPNCEERFRSHCKAAITQTVANRGPEKGAQTSELVKFLHGVYGALSDASLETASALGWSTLRNEWCVLNASRVRDFIEWTLRRHDHFGGGSSYEWRLKEYLRWRWASNRSVVDEAEPYGASLALLDRLICVASVETLRSADVSSELLNHCTEVTGLCAPRLREALQKPPALERTVVDIWWLRAMDGHASKVRRSRWMHNVNHFLFDEYTTLVDAVCDRFGIAVAIGFTEDKASLWKVRHEDAVRCVHFASTCLSFDERSELERTYATGPYPNVAYHIPLRVTRLG